MSYATKDRLLPLVESFFREHLQRMCGASPHTVRAYRDALRLLFNFLADRKNCSVADLQLTDLHVESIKAFLVHLESQRANTPASRNYRLTAIRSFFRHLVRNDLTHAAQYQQVLALPSKKTRTVPASYLEPEDARLILKQPDCGTILGQRDHALLLFLYNTGARVSEALGVRNEDLSLGHPRQVRLHGKNRKDRFCPLWRETADNLRRLPSVREARPGDIIFRNVRGNELTRDGVAYILRKYTALAARKAPALRRAKNHSPCHAAWMRGRLVAVRRRCHRNPRLPWARERCHYEPIHHNQSADEARRTGTVLAPGWPDPRACDTLEA